LVHDKKQVAVRRLILCVKLGLEVMDDLVRETLRNYPNLLFGVHRHGFEFSLDNLAEEKSEEIARGGCDVFDSVSFGGEIHCVGCRKTLDVKTDGVSGVVNRRDVVSVFDGCFEILCLGAI
jgi:hypothetical protein